ncbi:MAG: BatD family protein [Chthoniobacter sp.]|nr:BatD family protein [Chthoniobacter sp.]
MNVPPGSFPSGTPDPLTPRDGRALPPPIPRRRRSPRRWPLVVVLALLLLAGIGVGIWAISAGPVFGSFPIGAPAPAPATAATVPTDIMLLLDASGSMMAEDFEMDGVRTSRFAVLKHQAAEFIKSHPEDSIGVVAFARAPYVLSPPSLDHIRLLAALDRVKVGKLGEDGTAIGSALIAGYAQLATEGTRKRVLVLVTDGGNNSGFIAPATAAEYVAAQKIELLAIALGRTGNAPIPVTDVNGKKAYQSVKVEVDEAALQHLADVAHGTFRAAPNYQALVAAFAAIETAREKSVAADFTATIPDRFRSVFGTATVEGDGLALKGPPIATPRPAATPAPSLALAPGTKPSLSPVFPATPAPLSTNPAAGTTASVTATLSAPSIHLGEEVKLTVTARDVHNFPQPQPFSIDGCKVQYLGSGQNISLRDGKMSTSREHNYALQPERIGTLDIPPQTVTGDGKSFQTPPLKLIVEATAAGAAQSASEGAPYAEIILASKDLKVDRPVHVTFRVGIDTRVRWQPTEMPTFLPEGFACEKLSEPVAGTEDHEGKTYDILTFQTTLTPLKAGRLTIGPATLKYVARKPRAFAGAKSPSGIFDDPFFSQKVELKVEAPAVEVDVQP